jgi:fumarate reductase flavoprotein subunit
MIHLGWAVFGDGGFQVNAAGRRFSHETEGYSEQALKILRQPGGVSWAVWDKRCDDIANEIDNHRQARAAGAIKDCATVADIAAVVGCDVVAMQETLDEVAAITRGEKRCPWGRDFSGFPPLAPPYRCAKLTGTLFHTQGGLEVDTSARVLRPDGSQFPNLFAGGGAARGLSGPADWGYLSGSGLLMATNLGRLAGEAAADLVTSG